MKRLLLIPLLFAICSLGEEVKTATTTATVLERVIQRACILSVQIKDPSQCRVVSLDLSPDTECRGPLGGKLKCSGFTVKLDGPGCVYTISKREGCESTNVKKVPLNDPGEPTR